MSVVNSQTASDPPLYHPQYRRPIIVYTSVGMNIPDKECWVQAGGVGQASCARVDNCIPSSRANESTELRG